MITVLFYQFKYQHVKIPVHNVIAGETYVRK